MVALEELFFERVDLGLEELLVPEPPPETVTCSEQTFEDSKEILEQVEQGISTSISLQEMRGYLLSVIDWMMGDVMPVMGEGDMTPFEDDFLAFDFAQMMSELNFDDVL